MPMGEGFAPPHHCLTSIAEEYLLLQVAPRINYTNKGQGNVTIRITSHDQAKLGYSVAVPLFIGLLNRIRNSKDAGEDEMY